MTRPLRRLTRAQQAVVGVVLIAVVAVVAGATVAVLASPPPGTPGISGAPLNNPGVFQTPPPSASAVPATVRIIVPSVSVDLPVTEGDGVHVPLNLALHYPHTAQPGSGSNSLFYAHGQKGMFYGLYSVHAGAEIRAVRSDGTVVTYRVHEIREVPWNALDILKPTPFEQIILLTCTSYNPYDPRLLVIGTPVAPVSG